VGLGSATAVAGDLIGSGDIKNDSVRSLDIKDGTVRQSDLTDGAQAALAGKDGERGPQGPKGEPGAAASDVLGTSVLGKTFPTTTVAEIGGSFTTRSTRVGSFELEPGTYLLSTDGFFITNEATSGKTRMQVAVRGVDGSPWGSDLGTCFTGLISTLNAREATCNTTRTVVIDELTTVDVKAFGYADDQGSADSGKVNATLSVSAVKVG
jgi:hypothetical protein